MVPAKKSQRRRMMGLSNMGKRAFETGRLGPGSGGKARGRPRRQRKQAPPLPYWFLYVAYATAWLWMLVSGYFIVIYGLSFERDMCSREKFAKNECRPGDEPVDCTYPTRYGCMDVTYQWLQESSMSMGAAWLLVEPGSLGFGVVRTAFLGSLGGLLQYYEEIKDVIGRFLPS